MSVFAQRVVAAALSQVGVREVGGNNKGPQVVQYQKATWLAPAAWPWCAAFTAWCLREALRDEAARKSIWLRGDGESWRCKDAAAYGWETWGEKKKLLLLDENQQAMPGDFVVYDYSHIGIVVEDQAGSNFIQTVEGNTDDAGGREGGGVYRKQRHYTTIRTLIRVPSR